MEKTASPIIHHTRLYARGDFSQALSHTPCDQVVCFARKLPFPPATHIHHRPGATRPLLVSLASVAPLNYRQYLNSKNPPSQLILQLRGDLRHQATHTLGTINSKQSHLPELFSSPPAEEVQINIWQGLCERRELFPLGHTQRKKLLPSQGPRFWNGLYGFDCRDECHISAELFFDSNVLISLTHSWWSRDPEFCDIS